MQLGLRKGLDSHTILWETYAPRAAGTNRKFRVSGPLALQSVQRSRPADWTDSPYAQRLVGILNDLGIAVRVAVAPDESFFRLETTADRRSPLCLPLDILYRC